MQAIIKVDDLVYSFSLDSTMALVELIKGTNGNIQALTIKEG